MTRQVALAALLDRLAELVDDVGEPDFADLYRRHDAIRSREFVDLVATVRRRAARPARRW